MADELFDACIVGSGAGGGAMAYALTRAGLRVALLEKGPHYRDADFFHDELSVCRRSYFVPDPMKEPHVVVRDGGAPKTSSDGWISCCVGGGTVHMSGFFFRMRPEDFTLRTRFGDVAGANVADWPFSYDELAPYYDEVERVIGVSGDAAAEGRSTPYPLGPIATHPAGALIDEACQNTGMRARQMARAILSAPYDGRAPCHYCGFCGSYGCEAGAKSSSAVTFVEKALATGNLTLSPFAMATRVTKAKDGRVDGVSWIDAREGKAKENRTRARVVIVACSAVETARLLLISELANGSGLVGKNLMFSTLSSGYGRFPVGDAHFGKGPLVMPFIDRAVDDFYVAPKEAGLPHAKAGTILFLLPHKNPIFQAEKLAITGGAPLFGAALKARMRRYFLETRTVEWEAFGEFLPHGGSAVTLDPKVRDRFGLAAARLEIAMHPASLAASDWLGKKARTVLDAAGALEQGTYDERIYTVLQAGTARMGKDPKTSVLDATGRSHEIKNLYVADSSGFPTSSGAPFTMTIMANALRVASKVIERGKKGEL